MLKAVLSLLFAAFFAHDSLLTLRSGVFRYRGKRHARNEEPKTFWAGVIWFGLLALVMLGYAAWLALRANGSAE